MRVAVVTNSSAGSGATGRPTPREIHEALEAAGVTCQLCETDGGDLPEQTVRAIEAHPDAIVTAGGDGTISSVVSKLAGIDIPLGIIPTGTLNHFARDLGIPLKLEDAVQTIRAGHARAVDVGTVNGRTFINNSSIGIYPQIVQKRDEIRERLGRGKWAAMLTATLTMLKRYPTVHVRINSPTVAFERDTPFVFVGNNRYEVSGYLLGQRQALDRRELALYFTNRTGRFGLFRLALRALVGHLNQDKDFNELAVDQVWIDARRHHLSVAIDGEVIRMTPPLHYQIRPGALKVLAPPPVEPPPAVVTADTFEVAR